MGAKNVVKTAINSDSYKYLPISAWSSRQLDKHTPLSELTFKHSAKVIFLSPHHYSI